MNSEPVVFLHIPKTGGIAVRKAIKRVFNNSHVLVHRGKARLNFLERVEQLGLKNPTMIAVIRHPVERLVSAYWYLKNGGTRHTSRDARDAERVFNDYEDLESFVVNGGLEKFYECQVHLRPQSFWMRTAKRSGDKYEISRKLKIFRYEEMNVRLALYLSEMTERTITFTVSNVTKNKERTVVTPQMRDIIEKVYEQDLQIWNAL